LCKGDTVSDVIAKLATELCKIMELLDITNYDIKCLSAPGCPPKDFHEFLQILINIICQLQGATPGTPPSIDAPPMQMPVASCFYYTDAFGNEITTMNVNDYLTSVGTNTCVLNSRVYVLEITVAQHTDQINTLITQVDSIPPVIEQTLIPVCSSSPVETSILTVVTNHEELICEIQSEIGTATEIYASFIAQCAGLGNSPQLGAPASNMNGLSGWNNNVLNLAGTINNLWLTICDIRRAVTLLQACCNQGCSSLSMTLYTSLNTLNLSIFITGPAFPAGIANCTPLGSSVVVTDGDGNSVFFNVDVVTFMNAEFVTALPVYMNIATDITTTITPCLKLADGTVCQSVLTSLIEDPASCPTVTYTPGTTDIGYSFISVTGTATYTVEVYTLGNVFITSDSQLLTGPAVGVGTLITGLINTTFKLRLVITSSTGVKTCPFTNVVLAATPLLPLTLASTVHFALLSDANITNSVAPSTYTGDVGTSSAAGAILNIVALDVTGILYGPGDPATLTASADMANMITQAGLLTTLPLVGGDNMTGDTITPGYWDGVAITLDPAGNVTFDALGNPSSVFIITGTTFAFGAGSTVTLINGATKDMIFWVASSTITIGAGCILKGTFIATGDISSGAATDINGRLLTVGNVASIDTNILYI
jgi:hypothetical protein